MSYKVLAFKDHKHDLRDDMESLYYVVVYSGVRWLPHNEVANLGEAMNTYFFDFKQDGAETTGGAQKHLNIDNGIFTFKFVWTDQATQRWMEQAFMIQHYQKSGMKTWTPTRFMEVWMIALNLNPSKSDRYEHVIRIGGKYFTSKILPATNSVNWNSASIMSRMKNASKPMERELKRSFEEIMTLEEPRNESAPVAVASGSNTSTSSKRLRQAVPIPDLDNNPFIINTGSQ